MNASAISRLSVIGRQCIAAVCVERFCRHHEILSAEIRDFVEHLWGIATVDEDSFAEWEGRFQALPASTWGGDLELIPLPLRADYASLAEGAIECSAATWYGSDIPGTLAAFESVLHVMHVHDLPVPDFTPFLCSSPAVLHGWGNRPTPEQLQLWRAQR
jgi:hypothetical protein